MISSQIEWMVLIGIASSYNERMFENEPKLTENDTPSTIWLLYSWRIGAMPKAEITHASATLLENLILLFFLFALLTHSKN